MKNHQLMPTFESIEQFAQENAKIHEQIALRLDPMFSQLISAIDIVKQFVRDNDCIIYGGSAMDYAFRTRGGKIYPDESLAIPDLDFFSADGPSAAYKLAKQLYIAGFAQTRVIKAFHVHTMRIDCGNFHWIADVSYMPKRVFDIIPTITYDGMKCVHPTFQRMDLHMSLSRPFFKAPQEAIFERWKKDVERFRMLESLFPAKEIGKSANNSNINIIIDMNRYKKVLITGFLGSQILLGRYKLIKSDTVSIEVSVPEVELIYFDVPKLIDSAHLGLENPIAYDKLTNILPARIVGYDKIITTMTTVYSNKTFTVGYVGVHINGKHFKISDCQSILQLLLGRYLTASITGLDTNIANQYLTQYIDLLSASSMKNMDPKLALQTEVFGRSNLSLTNLVEQNKIAHDLYGVNLIPLPEHYKPSKTQDPPTFNPEDSIIYHEDGKEIPILNFSKTF